jgi:hypothetical protein
MFSNAERQKERTGKYGTSRDEFLQELVTQFQQTVSEETKEQVVAHLANFAYDPFNYDILRKLHVLDLFMDCLTEANEKLIEFGVGGLCNCSPGLCWQSPTPLNSFHVNVCTTCIIMSYLWCSAKR